MDHANVEAYGFSSGGRGNIETWRAQSALVAARSLQQDARLAPSAPRNHRPGNPVMPFRATGTGVGFSSAAPSLKRVDAREVEEDGCEHVLYLDTDIVALQRGVPGYDSCPNMDREENNAAAGSGGGGSGGDTADSGGTNVASAAASRLRGIVNLAKAASSNQGSKEAPGAAAASSTSPQQTQIQPIQVQQTLSQNLALIKSNPLSSERVGEVSTLSAQENQEYRGLYREALAHYLSGNWSAARDRYTTILRKNRRLQAENLQSLVQLAAEQHAATQAAQQGAPGAMAAAPLERLWQMSPAMLHAQLGDMLFFEDRSTEAVLKYMASFGFNPPPGWAYSGFRRL